MIYDKDEDTPQWKMAIVQGRADDGDNDNNVLVDYVRDPYKQSGVAVSLRLDNFGDDANDNKTWFRIDYHKAIRMRKNAAAIRTDARRTQRVIAVSIKSTGLKGTHCSATLSVIRMPALMWMCQRMSPRQSAKRTRQKPATSHRRSKTL